MFSTHPRSKYRLLHVLFEVLLIFSEDAKKSGTLLAPKQVKHTNTKVIKHPANVRHLLRYAYLLIVLTVPSQSVAPGMGSDLMTCMTLTVLK